jgi:uncharacterized protein (DUF2147 family)
VIPRLIPTLTVSLAAAVLAVAAAQATPAPPQGVWLTASGNVQVEIAPCGDALCGVVVKVLANNSMARDGASAAPPAQVGLKILIDLKPAETGTWRGHIFNRENGKTYGCIVEPQGADALKIRAYVWIPMFGKDQVWRRVP